MVRITVTAEDKLHEGECESSQGKNCLINYTCVSIRYHVCQNLIYGDININSI